MDSEFIEKLRQTILDELGNEGFGVSELAESAGMSRSNLLRKIQKEKGVSASIFIRQVRLDEAVKLLEQGDKTVSEISFIVGFGTPSYFTRCFREQYGYPPGEHQQAMPSDDTPEMTGARSKYNKAIWFLPLLLIGMGSLLMAIYFFKPQKQQSPNKSIAVLPFKNNSSDSDNIYVINGLTEAVLNNLQSLKKLKVISRTSVEKYRHSQLSAPEIARELNVDYIVEGSGQKAGNRIQLNVQLIEASKDDHLWGEQYDRDVVDIFEIQKEVAQKIASAIEIVISPQEKDRIEKTPTENMQAYDDFLRGVEYLNKETDEGLKQGINLLRKAIAEDSHFAKAHAVLAMAYYYRDLFKAEKQYNDSLIYFADKALLNDPQSAQGLTAKALYYIRLRDYEQAVDYLLKALEYNPNSALVINTLSDLYTNHIPDSEKYLRYALMALNLDIKSQDSLTASYTYLHIANALVQNGFSKEALTAINKSLAYNPYNVFSAYVKPYIIYANDHNLKATKKALSEVYRRDTTRLDLMEEMGSVCYYLGEWDEAYRYYNHFLNACEAMNIDFYMHKYPEIASVMRHHHEQGRADTLMSRFRIFIENNKTIYKDLYWSSYYAYYGDKTMAFEHLNRFSGEDHIQIWVPLFMPVSPLMDQWKDDPDFIAVMDRIKRRFWKNHESLKKALESQNLLAPL